MTKAQFETYLKFIPNNKNIKKFILEKCKIEFAHPLCSAQMIGHYVGFCETTQKHIIRFHSFNPRPFTFFHEIAHAFLNHRGAKYELWVKQEREADSLASEWLNIKQEVLNEN